MSISNTLDFISCKYPISDMLNIIVHLFANWTYLESHKEAIAYWDWAWARMAALVACVFIATSKKR